MAGELIPYEPNEPYARELAERLVYWDNFFKTGNKSRNAKDEKKAIGEFDQLWSEKGLMNKHCIVSGEGTWTEIKPYTDQIDTGDEVVLAIPNDIMVVERAGHITAKSCISTGFNIFGDEESTGDIAYQFMLPDSYVVVRRGLGAHVTSMLHINYDELELLLPMDELPEQPEELTLN